MMLLLASCSSDDSFVDFTKDDEEPMEEYSFCTDSSNFETDRTLTISDLAGEYAQTRELVCGVSGCQEAPFVNVQFAGIHPTFSLTENGAISNPNGVFEDYETWSIVSPNHDEGPHSLQLIDVDGTEDTYQMAILEAGPCRLRVQNNQGWIEYVRLEKL
jgi:hypothetical protein